MYWALTFALAGMAARYALQTVLETRYLIPLFCLIAALLELAVLPALGFRRDWGALVLNCAAAGMAIVAMKWMIEGVHPWLR